MFHNSYTTRTSTFHIPCVPCTTLCASTPLTLVRLVAWTCAHSPYHILLYAFTFYILLPLKSRPYRVSHSFNRKSIEGRSMNTYRWNSPVPTCSSEAIQTWEGRLGSVTVMRRYRRISKKKYMFRWWAPMHIISPYSLITIISRCAQY